MFRSWRPTLRQGAQALQGPYTDWSETQSVVPPVIRDKCPRGGHVPRSRAVTAASRGTSLITSAETAGFGGFRGVVSDHKRDDVLRSSPFSRRSSCPRALLATHRRPVEARRRGRSARAPRTCQRLPAWPRSPL